MRIGFILFLAVLCLAQNEKYQESLSRQLVQLSKAIYDINKANQAANQCPTCNPQFTPLKQILGNFILAMVGVNTELESIIVVFRGSANIPNWLTDADIIWSYYDEDPEDCKNCYAHEGFYNSYRELVQQGLEIALKKAVRAYPKYGVIFTGHSLGGAIANLAAVGFRQKYPKASVKLYTFGQPRVGNDKYAEYVNKQISTYFRVVNKRDIVPHKPAYIAFYRHSGSEIWYKDGMEGDYHQCKGESNNCSNGLGYSILDYSTIDHFSKNYIKILQKAAPGIISKVFNSVKKLDKNLIEFESSALFKKKQYKEPNDLFDGHEIQ